MKVNSFLEKWSHRAMDSLTKLKTTDVSHFLGQKSWFGQFEIEHATFKAESNTSTCTSRKHAYIILTPLNPTFIIVKLGFTGVYIIFLISAQKHRLWVLSEAVLTSTHNLYFEQKYEKYQFLPVNFRFLEMKFSIYLNRPLFVMAFRS